MAKAISVILEVAGAYFDLNKMGLVSMSFTRTQRSTGDSTTSVLPVLDMTLFDATGWQVLSMLQKTGNTLRLRYGYEDALSKVFKLTLLKYNVTYENMGCMVGVQAVADQVIRETPAELFPAGTAIEDIIKQMAIRNGWHVDEASLNCKVRLTKPLYKKAAEKDYDFILNSLLPIANSSVVIIDWRAPNISQFYEVMLTGDGYQTTLYFRPRNIRDVKRRIWKYTYGVDTNSQVINVTNKIDMSFLMNGLTVKMPLPPEEIIFLQTASLDELESRLDSIIVNKFDYVTGLLEKYNLPIPGVENFKWNVQVVSQEEIGQLTPQEYIVQALEQTMRMLNTIELTVIGNPQIMVTDLIELDVRNKDGLSTIISSSASTYWRIVEIQEEIGLGGYQTQLKLVREEFNTPLNDVI